MKLRITIEEEKVLYQKGDPADPQWVVTHQATTTEGNVAASILRGIADQLKPLTYGDR